MTYTEEGFRNMGRIAADEVAHSASMVARDLSDDDFAAKVSVGGGGGDPTSTLGWQS